MKPSATPRTIRWLVVAIFAILPAWTQSAQKELFEDAQRQIVPKAEEPIGELMVVIGETFLGIPYEGYTLESETGEDLVVRFDRYDCFTFAESVLALARTLKIPRADFERYRGELRTIRYRDGTIDGYPSRLHYTSDWAHDNHQKGVVVDITRQIGGEPYPKTIDFMTKHRPSYPALAKSEADWKTMQEVERAINQRKRFYIPKAKVRDKENLIQDGDIVAITTSIKGLDVVHVGLAVRRQGRIHMLHASSRNQKVEITEQPLHDYLAKHKTQTGLMVFRPSALR
ncbi:DUF1460 domain-containing protein [Sulfidibacter corallicola]